MKVNKILNIIEKIKSLRGKLVKFFLIDDEMFLKILKKYELNRRWLLYMIILW